MCLLFAAMAFAVAYSAPAFAISASEYTPESLRPEAGVKPLPAPVQSAPDADSAVPGAELRFIAGDIVLENGFADLDDAVTIKLAQASGRRLTVGELLALASDVEAMHAQAGFLLARVVVPPQNIVDHGRVRLVLVDGHIDEIGAEAVPERHRAATVAVLEHLIGRKRLRTADIERALLIAGGLAGLKLTSALAAGDAPGTTRLILAGTARLLSGAVSVDNRQGESVGNWGVTGSVALNSLFGRGEQIYGSVSSPTELSTITATDPPMRVTGFGAVIPVGVDGLTINPEYTQTRTFGDEGLGAPTSRGQLQRVSLRVGYPIRWTRAESLNFNTTLEMLDETTELVDFSTLLWHDRYLAVRPGLEWQFWATPELHLSSSLVLSQGLGGRDREDAERTGTPLSRLGGSPYFTHLNLNLDATRQLASDLALHVNLRAQTSFGQAMLQNERFSLDGTRAVSAFASGPFRVDEGATLRAELQRSLPIELDSRTLVLSPYVFAAAGYGVTRRPTILEPDDVMAGGLGVGVRSGFALFDDWTSNTLGVEVGRQFTDVPGVSEDWRFNINFSASF